MSEVTVGQLQLFACAAKHKRQTRRIKMKQINKKHSTTTQAATKATVTMLCWSIANASQVLLKCRYHSVSRIGNVKCHSFHKFIVAMIYDAVLSGAACFSINWLNSTQQARREKQNRMNYWAWSMKTVIFGGEWMRTLLTIRLASKKRPEREKKMIRGNEVIRFRSVWQNSFNCDAEMCI